MSSLVKTLWTYWQASRLKFDSRAALEAYQQRRITRHLAWLASSSKYFAPYAQKPLSQWPRMDKGVMMDNFDAMNTAGLRLADVFDVALRSERDRDFAPLLSGYTVGLSSGTSARRGVFVASAAERGAWAGIILAKALPRGLFAGERVALFLRANSSLYTAVESRWLTFRFFDLFAAFESHHATLCEYAPTVLVAPAQVLRQLALAKIAGKLPGVVPVKVISAAEVLEPADRELIVRAFGAVHELYQATEGFLASTCAHGTLHLNEDFVHVEPEWLDERKERFVPVITDFTRTTQPIVRYRLNDVLVRKAGQCPCGSPAMALHAIEGRCDDMLELPSATGEPVHAFADVVSRALAQSLPVDADYALVQTGPTHLKLTAQLPPEALERVREHVARALEGLGVAVEHITWTLENKPLAVNLTAKRRRIRREL
jgi:putative adenylate-forming enzyme